MAISEEERLELYRSMEHVHGRRVATTLMGYLPPVGWADVARQSDLAALGTELRSEMHIGFTQLSARMDRFEARFDARFEAVDQRFETFDSRFEAIDARFDAFEARMNSKVDQLRAEMHEGFGAMRTDFAAIIAAQTRSTMLLVLGCVLTVAALAFALARFP